MRCDGRPFTGRKDEPRRKDVVLGSDEKQTVGPMRSKRLWLLVLQPVRWASHTSSGAEENFRGKARKRETHPH